MGGNGNNKRRAASRTVLATLVVVLAVTAACSRNRNRDRLLFDGQEFRTRANPVDKKVTLADFTVTVEDVSRSLDGAREAGRYQGTRYCIENYGTSKIAWAVGPDTDPAQLRVVDNRLTFQGECERT